jgi:colicin import membrane protein
VLGAFERQPAAAASRVPKRLRRRRTSGRSQSWSGAGLMARKLKAYQTSLGFFDLAIAAPSMKAALEAWGAQSNLFHQGVAKKADDPEVVAATMAKPGVVLGQPVGTNKAFREHAGLPTNLPGDAESRSDKSRTKTRKQPFRKISDQEARKAALAFEKEQMRSENERRREESARAKERAGIATPTTLGGSTTLSVASYP